MRQIITLLILVNFHLPSFSQVNNYNSEGSVTVLSDKTHISITTINTDISEKRQAAGAVIGAVAPPLVDLFIGLAKTAAKQNALKFQGQYKASSSSSKFYQDENHINLPVLELTRQILRRGQSAAEIAVTIKLVPELSGDKTAFRFKVDAVTYNYSIAKTIRDFDYIEAAVDIKFRSVTVVKNEYQVKDLRGTTIIISMIKPGAAYKTDPDMPIYSGWIPFPPPITVSNEVLKIDREKKTVVTNSKKGEIVSPTETNNQEVTTEKKQDDVISIFKDAGMYEVDITVTETNPYKIRSENKHELIENSGDKLSDVLKAVAASAVKN